MAALKPIVIATLTFIAVMLVTPASADDNTATLGINLAGPVDWNTELPLVDVFRLSRTWISQREGTGWGEGPELDLDQHGWVRSLQPDCWVDTPLCTIDGGHYPAGHYTVLYEGEGTFEFWGAASIVRQSPGRIIINVDPRAEAIWLRIRSTNPANYLRNIHVIMPGFEPTWQREPWHPAFLKRWQGFSCIRFMDFMHTNNSTVQTWDDRPTMDDATWTPHGLPLEMMCDLVNRLDADPWFCMPHLADDDYIRRFAQQAQELLEPGRTIYIEYSNEVWNGIFSQHHHAGQMGIDLGFAKQPWEAAWYYTAYRSRQIFDIWEDVFDGRERLIRVLPTQAANPYVTRQILEFQNAGHHADVLAIAPYFGMIVPPEEADEVLALSLDQLLDHVENHVLPEAIGFIRQQKAIADEFDLQLVAYEAGQHLVGTAGAENNQRLTRLFHAANRHERMGQLYRQYYDAWNDAGGNVMCVFSSVSAWSKWGSWGLMQHSDEDPNDYPKFRETLRWAAEHGQNVNHAR